MEMSQKRRESRVRRHRRIRRKMQGTTDVPRMAVHRTIKHIYVQFVDDSTGRSLAGTSTLDPQVREQLGGKSKTQRCQLVGKRAAEIAKEKGIERVAFDRGGNVYHGRIRALAESAREAGLKF